MHRCAPQGAFVAAAAILRRASPSASSPPACAPPSSWNRATLQFRAFRSRSAPRSEFRPRRDDRRWQRAPAASRDDNNRISDRRPRTSRDDVYSPKPSSSRDIREPRWDERPSRMDEASEYSPRRSSDDSDHEWQNDRPYGSRWRERRDARPQRSFRDNRGPRRDERPGRMDETSEYSPRRSSGGSGHEWQNDRPYGSRWREGRDARPQRSLRGKWSDGRRYGDENPRNRGSERGENAVPSELQRALSSGDDLLYGLQSVHLALTAGRRDLHTLYLQTEGAKNGSSRKQANTRLRGRILAQAEALNIRVCERDKGELNVLSGNRPHQGTVLRCAGLEYVPLQTLDEGEQGDLFVALDEVRDPQNVGALLRSAHFLGVKGVAVCRKNSSPISPVVSRASAGAAEIMEVYGVESMPKFLRDAAEKGWRILGAAGEKDAVPLGDVVTGPPTVLVLGSEGDGLRSMVRACCANLVTIAKGDGCVSELDSLNVSVAGALAMFHLLRR